MRILQETEKKYNSITMDLESSKVDLKYMDSHYKFKTKADYVTPTILLVGVVLVIIGLIMVFNVLIPGIISIVLGFGTIGIGVFLYLKKNNAKRIEFLKHYDAAIIQNSKIKYIGSKAISSLYPIYLEVDNEMKTFKLIYHDKDEIYCEYDDILNYRLLINDKEIEETILPNEPIDSPSYVLEITFNNKKKAQITFSNTNPKFKLDASFNNEKISNTLAINNIAKVMDMIIMKNVVDLNNL